MGRFKSLSPGSFFFGLFNVALTCIIIGRYPQHYWIFQMIKCIYYLGASWVIKYDQKEMLYMAEFCWFSCHLQMIWLILAFVAAMGVDELKPYTSN